VSADGTVYLLDSLNRPVVEVSKQGATKRVPIPGSDYPRDIVESNGVLYVLDNWKIIKISLSGAPLN